MNPESESQQALNQWLIERHNKLIRDLAETLDLEAGLRDAMIPARHTRLVAELRDALDVESGLGAIVHDTGEETLKSTSEVTINLDEISELRDLVQILASQDARGRLEFRTHSATRSYLRSYACGCIYVCDAVLDLTSRSIDAIEQAVRANQDRSFATARAVAEARTLIRNLTEFTDRTATPDQGFDADLRHSRQLARELTGVLDRADTLRIARELARSLEEDLDRLDSILNDFAGADLRNIKLEGMLLGGLRWTSSTRWPPTWFDRIKSDSIQIGSGIYEIRAREIEISLPMHAPGSERERASELESLRGWLETEPELTSRVGTIEREPPKGELEGVVEVLLVSVGPSGVLSVLARGLVSWLSQRRGVGTSIQVRGKDGKLLEIDVSQADTRQVETLINQALGGSIED
jgi:hypothetical protein